MRLLLLALTLGVNFWLPSSRVQAQTLPAGATFSLGVMGLAVSGPTLFATGADPTKALQTYSLSTPASPYLRATVASRLPGAPPGRQVAVSANTAFVASYDYAGSTISTLYLTAYDVSNPAAPTLRTTIQLNIAGLGTNTLSIASSGGYLYLAYGLGGLIIYDATLAYVGGYPVNATGNVLGLLASGTTLYVAQTGSQTSVFNLSSPASPSLVGTVVGSLQAVSGPYGYGLLYPFSSNAPTNVLLTYDVSTPTVPRLIGQTNVPASGTLLAAVAQGRALFTAGDAGRMPTNSSSRLAVQGYNATTATAPVPAGSDPASIGGSFSLVGNGDYAYAAVANNIFTYGSGAVLATRASAASPALLLYPVPAHGLLQLPGTPPATAVTICDALGRPCLHAALPASGSLDIRALPAGLYLVRAGAQVARLVVE